MYKSCSKCGKIHDTKYKCNAIKRIYNNDIKERKLRNTYKWQKKSEQIRHDSNYLCAVCRDNGIYNYANIEVHHIVKLKDAPNKLLDENNLICLCQKHHKQADKGKISIDYLRKLVDNRQKRVTPRD